jgi:SAM-dependent methyltransferase
MAERQDYWESWLNAEIYREYVEAFPVYRALNAYLAELARVESARRVLDLGCGAGATTAACLKRLSPHGEIVALDASRAMIETARTQVSDPRARFIRADAHELERAFSGTFDRVVCNAAFSLFSNRTRVVTQVRRMLAPGGLFVFNAPLEGLDEGRFEPEPFQLALGQAVRDRTGEHPSPSPRLDLGAMRRSLAQNGLRICSRHSFRYRGRQEEMMELMQVPAMASRLTTALGRDECVELVREVAERCDPRVKIEVPWLYWVVSRDDN